MSIKENNLRMVVIFLRTTITHRQETSGAGVILMDVFKEAKKMMHICALQAIMVLLGVADCRVLEGLPRFSSIPTYLPVDYKVLNAESAFFLKEANQDFMRNSSLLTRTEPFFIYQARGPPSVNASYGPLSVEQPVPLELLHSPAAFPPSSSLFTFNWKVQTFIIDDKIHLVKPKVQVLFYVAGRDWDDYSAVDKLPCVRLLAFHETQEVRGSCQLRGVLGLCVAELEPLAGWFSPPSVVPGRQRSQELAEGTPVELYYMLQSTQTGECHSEEVRKGNSIRSDQEGMFGSSTSTPMQRIGSVRLYQSPVPPPLAEHRLDSNFLVLVPATPLRQRDTMSAFVTASAFSPVEMFTLRVKLKEGLTFLGARPSNPTLWMVSQDARSEGHRVVTLHCRRKEASYGQSRTEGGVHRVLQVDLKVDSFPDAAGSRWIAWQVEYPGSRSTTQDTETEIRLALEDLGGIVPLAMGGAQRQAGARGPEGRPRAVCLTRYTGAGAEEAASDRAASLVVYPRGPGTHSPQAPRHAVRTGNLQGIAALSTSTPTPAQTRSPLSLGDPGAVPLSDSILAEKTVTVVDDKVTITELGVQLVTGLSLSLQLSTGSTGPSSATATTQEVLRSPKQEALISAWLQFSDGSMAPLDLYDPDYFILTATSLDEEVVTVQQDPSWKWPVIVTEAEGQGLLVRVEMTVCEPCLKFKRRSVLAAGNCNVRVKFGGGDYGPEGEEMENRANDRRQPSPSQDRTGLDAHYYGSSISNMEDGLARRATTTKSALVRRPDGGKMSDDGGRVQNAPVDFSDFPAQVDLPRGRNLEDDLLQTARGLTDLEIGMYALLGVFCLAILVFLINCISYTLKYRHKELSVEGQESMNHAHDWVWLGNEAELLESRGSLSPQQEEQVSMMDSSAGLEEGSHLLNGGSSSPSSAAAQKNVQGQVHRAADTGGPAAKDKGDSPTTKRKRVKFTTFTTIPPDDGCPMVNTLSLGHSQDIKWVCQDVQMGDSKELRNYMERLNDNALKEVA
ncbi:transmembrane protein 132C [Osmerus eperlanus]|uniref:transmembrane protein 132C n=1 Tax=Osmerus eperlanus TaxID=29151 RepID=UPI002E0F6B6D